MVSRCVDTEAAVTPSATCSNHEVLVQGNQSEVVCGPPDLAALVRCQGVWLLQEVAAYLLQ